MKMEILEVKKRIYEMRKEGASYMKEEFVERKDEAENEIPTEARGEAPSKETHSIWWTSGDSNPRPPPCKGGALPTELLAPISKHFVAKS